MILLWPWTSTDAMLETFLPTALQAEGLLAVLASGLVMVWLWSWSTLVTKYRNKLIGVYCWIADFR